MQSRKTDVIVHTCLNCCSIILIIVYSNHGKCNSMLQGNSELDSTAIESRYDGDVQTSYNSIQSHNSSHSLHTKDVEDCCLDAEAALACEIIQDHTSSINQTGA